MTTSRVAWLCVCNSCMCSATQPAPFTWWFIPAPSCLTPAASCHCLRCWRRESTACPGRCSWTPSASQPGWRWPGSTQASARGNSRGRGVLRVSAGLTSAVHWPPSQSSDATAADSTHVVPRMLLQSTARADRPRPRCSTRAATSRQCQPSGRAWRMLRRSAPQVRAPSLVALPADTPSCFPCSCS